MAQPAAMVDDAYQQMRRMIVTGQLAPRERLSQRALAKRLGMSTMPIVEALRRLEQDGWVERLPQYGAYVKEWTAGDIEEAFLIRRALEGEAARQMAQHAPEAEKQTLIELSEQLDAAMHRGDVEATVELELAFHLHLARCSQLPKLYQVLEAAHVLSRSLYMWPGRLSNPLEIGDHWPIAEAIRDGKGEVAQQAMFEHIDNALNGFRKHQAQAALSHARRPSVMGSGSWNMSQSGTALIEAPLEVARTWLRTAGTA